MSVINGDEAAATGLPTPKEVAHDPIVCVRIRFHNYFICVGVDISIYALLTGGRS